jgi:hypothetical protein
VGLERGPLSLVSTNVELLGRNSSGYGLENREYGRRDPSSWASDTLYPQTLALTSPTSGGRSVYFALWFRPRSLVSFCLWGWVGVRSSLVGVEKRNILHLPGLKLEPLLRPACCQSLYRPRYLAALTAPHAKWQGFTLILFSTKSDGFTLPSNGFISILVSWAFSSNFMGFGCESDQDRG